MKKKPKRLTLKQVSDELRTLGLLFNGAISTSANKSDVFLIQDQVLVEATARAKIDHDLAKLIVRFEQFETATRRDLRWVAWGVAAAIMISLATVIAVT